MYWLLANSGTYCICPSSLICKMESGYLELQVTGHCTNRDLKNRFFPPHLIGNQKA